MQGWKTWTGAGFGAVCFFINQIQPLVPDTVYQYLIAGTGAISVFLTAVGVAHKIEKGPKK